MSYSIEAGGVGRNAFEAVTLDKGVARSTVDLDLLPENARNAVVTYHLIMRDRFDAGRLSRGEEVWSGQFALIEVAQGRDLARQCADENAATQVHGGRGEKWRRVQTEIRESLQERRVNQGFTAVFR